MEDSEAPEQTATVTVTVSAALVARLEQLERALARARGRGEQLRRERDELASELERIARLGDVATEASSRLRPLARQAADGAAAPQELAEACAWVAELLTRLRPRHLDVETPQAVYRQADRRVAEDLAAIGPAVDGQSNDSGLVTQCQRTPVRRGGYQRSSASSAARRSSNSERA